MSQLSEWTQVTVLIEAVRSITGETWSPDEIRFKSDFSVCDAAREANPNTRFVKRSAHTSIIGPALVLAASQSTPRGCTSAGLFYPREDRMDRKYETSDPPLPS